MADLIQRVSQSTQRTRNEEAEVLEEAPRRETRGRGQGQSGKSGRVLPWFLQDNDDDLSE